VQLEPHFPEDMRGPEVWSWLESSPDMRKQLAKQMAPTLGDSANLEAMLGAAGNGPPQQARSCFVALLRRRDSAANCKHAL
jgi:hypothetical protein